jgi:hypothetical protein
VELLGEDEAVLQLVAARAEVRLDVRLGVLAGPWPSRATGLATTRRGSSSASEPLAVRVAVLSLEHLPERLLIEHVERREEAVAAIWTRHGAP